MEAKWNTIVFDVLRKVTALVIPNEMPNVTITPMTVAV